jgi:hypothetical protein
MKKILILVPLLVTFSASAATQIIPIKGLHFLLQTRYDYGDLLYRNGDFKTKGDLYIRRFRLIFKRELNRYFSIKFNIAADRWFQNYKKGKEKQTPKKVIFKAAYIKWKPFKNFYISFGRGKKPVTRAGLNSSKNLIFIDKAKLYLELKKFLGDYYATQLELGGNLLNKLLRFRLATAYAYPFHTYNGLKKTPVHLRQNLLNNYFFRFEISPPGWVEEKMNNTTFGKKAINLGFSFGYFGKFSVYENGGFKRASGHLSGVDFFVRKPNLVKGTWVFQYEYLKGKYLISEASNVSKEVFYVRLGYRPYLPLRFPLEIGAGFEDINSHPGAKRKYIYEGGLNLYSPNKKVKFTLGLNYTRYIRSFSDKSGFILSSQIQFYF